MQIDGENLAKNKFVREVDGDGGGSGGGRKPGCRMHFMATFCVATLRIWRAANTILPSRWHHGELQCSIANTIGLRK